MNQWAHFPHIHFGMASNQKMKKMNGVCQQVRDQNREYV